MISEIKLNYHLLAKKKKKHQFQKPNPLKRMLWCGWLWSWGSVKAHGRKSSTKWGLHSWSGVESGITSKEKVIPGGSTCHHPHLSLAHFFFHLFPFFFSSPLGLFFEFILPSPSFLISPSLIPVRQNIMLSNTLSMQKI